MKKILFRFVSLAVVVCLILGCVAGCGSDNQQTITLARYNEDNFSSNVSESGLICENEYWELHWDNTKKLVSFKDKATGNVWGQIPEKALNSDAFLTNSLKSAVYVYYREASTLGEKYAYSSEGAVENGNVWATKCENGLSVTYDFYEYSFSVTVDYILDGNKFSTTVDPSKMSDDGENYITGVSVMPFICGVENDSTTDWIFMPDGSGAVIKPATISSMGVSGEAKVYGDDLSIHQYYFESVKQQIKMPIFGTVRENGGLFAIISSGAEQSSICWDMGSSTVGYSSVYPFFRIRGYSLEKTPSGFGWTALNYIKLFDESVTETVFKADYYSLSAEKANLVGMAEIYRNYLTENHNLTKSNVAETSVNYKFVGATVQPDFFLGIPTTKLFPLTTTDDVKEITGEISKSLGSDFSVNLVGFGNSGIDEGEIAGGFNVASSLGGWKGFKKLTESLEKLNVNSFLDFDVVSLAESGSGFSYKNDAATVPNGSAATFGKLNSVSHATYQNNYHLLSRKLLPDAILKVLDKKNKLAGSGVSFNSLANSVYSDYSYNDFRNCKNMASDVKAMFGAVKKQNVTLSSASANDYAASVSDVLTDCPISSSEYDFSTYSVPFYQMVFKGYKPMSSVSLNLTSDANEALLTCIESGMSPSYTVVANYENELRTSYHSFIYGSVYENQKEALIDTAKQASEYFGSIKGAEIIEYTVVNDDVRITEFSNGVFVVVNYGDTEYNSEYGVVKAQSYITGKGA